MKQIERDNYIAWVGLTHDDIQIWGQYEKLVDFIYEEFPKSNRRFEEISLPTLFVLSHGIELALKENIKFFREYHESPHLTKFENWTILVKSHDLDALSDEFKTAYIKLHKKVKANENDKLEFMKYYKYLNKLIKLLDRNSETYRYSSKINNNGEIVKNSIKQSKIIDFLEIKDLYIKIKTLFVGAPNSLGKYTDYIDFKRGNPTYEKGKGYLYCQRLHYTEHFLSLVKTSLSESLTSLSSKTWLDPQSGENFEIQVWRNDIYIISI